MTETDALLEELTLGEELALVHGTVDSAGVTTGFAYYDEDDGWTVGVSV